MYVKLIMKISNKFLMIRLFLINKKERIYCEFSKTNKTQITLKKFACGGAVNEDE
jgi:hypothetical protein